MTTNNFKDWMLTTFTPAELADIAHYGCVSTAGFNHFVDRKNTTALYARYKAEIWGILYIYSCDKAKKHPLTLLSDFRGSQDVTDAETFENLLVWFAAEHIAREETNED